MSNVNDSYRLLVPFHIDALLVGNRLPDGIFQWTNLAPDFSKLQNAPSFFFGSELVGEAGNFFTKADGLLEPGIHLHFRLPRALKHGTQTGSSDVSFPTLPNRWLVYRLFEDRKAPGKLSFKAWLIRTDNETDDPSSRVTWPSFYADKPAEFKRIGAVLELTSQFSEVDQKANLKITAVGQGNPSFSAYYPASRGVLGFYDSMEGVPNPAGLSYLVTGWYSDPQDDPLFMAEFRKKTAQFSDLQAWAKEWGWVVADPSPASFNPPSRLLFHGLVRGIAWEGPEKNYMQSSGGAQMSPPAVFPLSTDAWKSSYKLAIGNTAGEAVTALLAPGEIDQDLLTALHDDMLSQPISASDLQYELHERRFTGVYGGAVYLLRPEPDPSRAKTTGQTNVNSGNPIPAGLQALLRDLNVKQQSCDRLEGRVEDLRWQVYALWFLWISLLRDGKDSEQLKQQLDAAIKALNAEHEALKIAKQRRDDSRKAVDAELGKNPWTQSDGTPTFDAEGKAALRYRLTVSSARPFQRRYDPAIAISGTALVAHNSWVPAGELKCRISGQQVTGITLEVRGGSPATIPGNNLAAALFPDWKKLPVLDEIHRSLISEALLLDGQNASRIAAMASQQDKDKLTKTVIALQDPASVEARANPPKDPNALVGRLPDLAATFNWKANPWIPLFLVWEVSWQSDYQPPASGSLPEDLVTRRWRLDRSGDFIPATDSAATGDENTYRGYSILTPSAATMLAKRLEALNESHPLINVIKNQRMQTQTLDGFNDALLLQQVGMQLPPFDFNKWFESQGADYKIDAIHKAINEGFEERRDTFRTTPRADGPFLPIRSGRLRIKRLSIVDAFGQTLILPIEQINGSAKNDWPNRMLRPAHSCVFPLRDGLWLPPRFAQSMRLRFAWANASSPGENGCPVCGWILPNHLEKSLMIYSAEGKPLGALQKKLDVRSGSSDLGFYWAGVPGVDISTVENIENTHLRYFCNWVLGLNPDDGGRFSGFMNDAIASADQRVPEEDPGVAILVGRPLALVRASVQFETAGLPAHRPTLRSGSSEQKSVDELLDTSGFEKVKWPLRLGEIQARNDALIGVFQCAPVQSGNDVATGGPFYPAWGQDKLSKTNVFGIQDFKIDCVQPFHVTMLMDPQARVHATTGALPRTFLELPPEDVTGARRARDVFFQTAPLLGLTSTPQMPRPSDDYGEWSWAFRPDVTHWKLDPSIVEATDRASFSNTWPEIAEGWLKLAIAAVKVLSFWVSDGDQAVAPGTRVHLAWSLQGTESLKLEDIRQGNVSTIDQWNSRPFPREYIVTVEAETIYRLTASAEGVSSTKEVVVKIKE